MKNEVEDDDGGRFLYRDLEKSTVAVQLFNKIWDYCCVQNFASISIKNIDDNHESVSLIPSILEWCFSPW